MEMFLRPLGTVPDVFTEEAEPACTSPLSPLSLPRPLPSPSFPCLLCFPPYSDPHFAGHLLLLD